MNTIKVTMTLQQRVAVVNQYLMRETRTLRDQMVSADIVDKINPTDDQLAEWTSMIPTGNGTARVMFTPAGMDVAAVEFDFSRAEATDLLNMVENVKLSIVDVKWARPLQATLSAALAASHK